MSKNYIVVYGPHTTGPFGTDTYPIEAPADVTETPYGSLVITTAAQPERDHPRAGRIPAKSSQQIIYPRGEWTKIKVGEYRRLQFQIDLDARLEKPEGVWDESWTDLLHAISVARVTGSVGTTSETLIEGRGRQAFKATRRRTIHDGTTLKNAVYDVEEVRS